MLLYMLIPFLKKLQFKKNTAIGTIFVLKKWVTIALQSRIGCHVQSLNPIEKNFNLT